LREKDSIVNIADGRSPAGLRLPSSAMGLQIRFNASTVAEINAAFATLARER